MRLILRGFSRYALIHTVVSSLELNRIDTCISGRAWYFDYASDGIIGGNYRFACQDVQFLMIALLVADNVSGIRFSRKMGH